MGMTKKQANRKAKELWGLSASAIPNSDPADRHNRFGVGFIEAGGAFSDRRLVVAGYGDSWEAAFELATKNPLATKQQQEYATAMAEFKEFGANPEAYLEKQKLKVEELKAQQEAQKENTANV